MGAQSLDLGTDLREGTVTARQCAVPHTLDDNQGELAMDKPKELATKRTTNKNDTADHDTAQGAHFEPPASVPGADTQVVPLTAVQIDLLSDDALAAAVGAEPTLEMLP
jgi:hypothetical protein